MDKFTLIDWLDWTLQLVTRIAVIVGLFFTARQIKNTIKIHKDNLNWNKRKAAQDALLSNNQNDIVGKLRESIDYNNITNPLSLEVINQKISEDREIQNSIQRLLDMYEAFSRGILQSIYDEEVIKNARKNSMIRAWNIFQVYIKDRREKINKSAWCEFESLVNRWKHEQTGKDIRKGSLFD
ncbi:MAG: DUF4760 domain-containing protein [Bacteroidota bacterium]